jgi:hypothetical protein
VVKLLHNCEGRGRWCSARVLHVCDHALDLKPRTFLAFCLGNWWLHQCQTQCLSTCALGDLLPP